MILVIGYGNELRGDDAVGPQIAEIVESWQSPQVRAFARHQLTPDLAEPLAAAQTAIFVDASIEAPSAGVQAHIIIPAAPEPGLGHTGDPRALLALTQALYGRCPQTWLITIPATRFDFGAPLSPAAQQGKAEALRHIRRLIRQYNHISASTVQGRTANESALPFSRRA